MVMKRRCVPVCLFGPPDPLESEKSYQEHVMRQQDNFQNTWGVNVNDPRMERVERLLLQRGPQQWEVVQEDRAEEDRVVPEVDALASPEGSTQDVVNTTSSPGQSRRAEPARYFLYQKQKKTTDTQHDKL